MLAIIKTGGKQYLVSPEDKIKIEKIEKEEGQEIIFKQVLLVEKNRKLELGTPFLKKAKVTGKIIRHARHKKVTAFRAGKRYRRQKGHKQPFTEVEIIKIEIGD